MKTSIKKELMTYIKDAIYDEVITDDNFHEWYYHLFNDYYLIGYYNCSQWITEHDIDIFEMLADIQDYEVNNFGEAMSYDNSEKAVNMYVYILGEELLSDLDADSIEELQNEIKEYLSE